MEFKNVTSKLFGKVVAIESLRYTGRWVTQNGDWAMQTKKKGEEIVRKDILQCMFTVRKLIDGNVLLESRSKIGHYLTVDESNRVSVSKLGSGCAAHWKIMGPDDSMEVVMISSISHEGVCFDAHHSFELRVAGSGYWSKFRIVELATEDHCNSIEDPIQCAEAALNYRDYEDGNPADCEKCRRSWFKTLFQSDRVSYTPICNKEGLWLYVLSFLLPCIMYIVDLMTDFFQAGTYFHQGNAKWGILTLCLVWLPGMVIGVLSYQITIQAWSNVVNKYRKRVRFFIAITCFLLLGPVLVTCVTLRKTGVIDNKSTTIRSFEGLGEGIPQFTLQLYIVASQNKITIQQLITLTFSLVGAAMGFINILFRNNRTVDWKIQYILGSFFLFLSVTSRLVSIALFMTWYEAVYIAPSVVFIFVVVTSLMFYLAETSATTKWLCHRAVIRANFAEVARSRIEWLVTAIFTGLFPVKMRAKHVFISSGCSTVAMLVLLLVFAQHLIKDKIRELDSDELATAYSELNVTVARAIGVRNWFWWNNPYSIQQYYPYLVWVLVAFSVLAFVLSFIYNHCLQEVVSDFVCHARRYPCIRSSCAVMYDGSFYVCCDSIVRQLDPRTLEARREIKPVKTGALSIAIYKSFICLGYGREKLVRVYNLHGEELFSVSVFHRCRWMTILTGGVVAVADERTVTLLNIDWNNGCVDGEKTTYLKPTRIFSDGDHLVVYEKSRFIVFASDGRKMETRANVLNVPEDLLETETTGVCSRGVFRTDFGKNGVYLLTRKGECIQVLSQALYDAVLCFVYDDLLFAFCDWGTELWITQYRFTMKGTPEPKYHVTNPAREKEPNEYITSV